MKTKASIQALILACLYALFYEAAKFSECLQTTDRMKNNNVTSFHYILDLSSFACMSRTLSPLFLSWPLWPHPFYSVNMQLVISWSIMLSFAVPDLLQCLHCNTVCHINLYFFHTSVYCKWIVFYINLINLYFYLLIN